MKDIPLFKVFMADSAIDAVSSTLTSGVIAQGPRVGEFEQSLRSHFNEPFITTVNSGTSAISLALHLAKRRSSINSHHDRDTVIATPLTCAASNIPIKHEGLRVEWADIDKDTLNICLDDVRSKMNYYTQGMIFTHWGGSPACYDALRELKEDYKREYGHDFWIIEDCAHSWGSRQTGNFGDLPDKRVGEGSPCDFSCFSCQAIKTLTTGDGGVIITNKNNEEDYALSRKLRWFGLDRDNKQDFRSSQDIPIPGFKYQMNDIAATIGINNLPHIDELVSKQRCIASTYNYQLQCSKSLMYQSSSYWLHTIIVKDANDFIRHMKNHGIQCSQVHSRNDGLSCFYEKRELKNMDALENKYVAIPCGWWMSHNDMGRVIDGVNSYE